MRGSAGDNLLAAGFDFEDLMGKIKICAQASMAGSSLPLIGSKIIEHSMLSLDLRLKQMLAALAEP